MKKLISLCLLLFVSIIVKAQSAEETLEWLRAKQPAIRGNSVTIDENSIRYSNNENKISIDWSKIKDVTDKYLEITIVGNELINGKNVFIRFSIDGKISEKFAKALKHLAELKGAKLVKDDLF